VYFQILCVFLYIYIIEKGSRENRYFFNINFLICYALFFQQKTNKRTQIKDIYSSLKTFKTI